MIKSLYIFLLKNRQIANKESFKSLTPNFNHYGERKSKKNNYKYMDGCKHSASFSFGFQCLV